MEPRLSGQQQATNYLVDCIYGMMVFNPLSPNSDENEISLYIISTKSCSDIEVMRRKKVITKLKDEIS